AWLCYHFIASIHLAGGVARIHSDRRGMNLLSSTLIAVHSQGWKWKRLTWVYNNPFPAFEAHPPHFCMDLCCPSHQQYHRCLWLRLRSTFSVLPGGLEAGF